MYPEGITETNNRHCVFRWYETPEERVVEIRADHCQRCIDEMRRAARVQGVRLTFRSPFGETG